MIERESVPAGYVSSLFDLGGKVAAVSGAGSGLGAALAVGLAQAGAAVALLDVNTDGMDEVAETIRAQGGRSLVRRCDVTSSDDLGAAVTEAARQFGTADILVNSAGSAYRAAAEDFPEERLDFILDLNLKGTYLACQAFGRPMLAQESGSIINLASIGGFRAYPMASAYLASKGGVVQLTKALALEWGGRGVRVNGIGPTLMESALTRAGEQVSSVTADFIKARMPQQRLGLPRQLVGAAIFLASSASELVNGHTVMCDDGYLTA